MGESQGLLSDINGIINKTSSLFPCLGQHIWWLQMIIYAFLVLAGQTIGTLLGQSYFDNGGKSKWIATLVQVAGFPILVPFLHIVTTKTETNTNQLASFSITIGLFLVPICMLYRTGLQYLPITTQICASQLGYNAVFTYFLNKQISTPYIINSLGLLTISSLLLIFQSELISEKKHIIGFLCTLSASSVYAFILFLTQGAFRIIVKKETIRAIIDVTIYQNLVATFVILIGLFASGDWKKMSEEMKEYKLGQVSYVTNLIWTAVCWQAFNVGCIGLMFKVSSLFSNVIGVLGLPVGPMVAVMFMNEKLTGLKAMAMLLAMLGFMSYVYQYYLDDLKMKEKVRSDH